MSKHQNSTTNSQGSFKPQASSAPYLRFGIWIFCRCGSLILGMSVACLSGPMLASAAAEPSAFALRQSAQVDSEGVFLDQVLDCTGLPALWLCDAPAFGKTTVLTRAKIIELAKENAPELACTNWSGPDSVHITRRARTLGEADALEMLRSALQEQCVKEKGELELRFARPWTPSNVPDEPLTLRVTELPNAGVTPAFIARFEIRTARETVGTWQTALQARIWREVWIAKAALHRGEPVAEAELGRERRDVSNFRETPAEFEQGDPNLELAEPLQTGLPLLARSIKPRPIIHRGQTASAMLQDGAMVITMKVEALEDGAPGQIIRLRNPVSHRDVRGRVLSNEMVLVSL
jgi:flagella basal body P-ring formation protein FlgA